MGVESSISETNSQISREKETLYPLFPLGRIVVTPIASEALIDAKKDPKELLWRHVTGDWGNLRREEQADNEFCLQHDLRIFSSYALGTGVEIWLLTEADRSVTTLFVS